MNSRIQALALTICIVAALPACAAETAGKGFPLRAAPAAHTTSTLLPSPAPATAPAVQSVVPGTGNFESQPLLFADNNRRQGRSGGFSMPSIWPALLAVAVVCAIFGGILYVMKKYVPGHRQLFSHPAMEVLGRTHLDQKRYVSLLRVGKRILVVGVGPDDMQSLSEIVEEDEITAIMEVARPKTEQGLTIFQRLFQRTVIETDAAEASALALEKTRQLHEESAALRERVESATRAKPKPQHVDALG